MSVSRSAIARIDKAIKAGETGQSRCGACVVCQRDWMSCPHTRIEVDELFEGVRLRKLLSKAGGT